MDEFDVRKSYRRIYAGFLSGTRINSVSMEAEATFWRLNLIADDFGNLPASIRILMGVAFPLREAIGPVQIAGWLGELENAKLVVRYCDPANTAVEYLHIVGFQELQTPKNGKRARKHPPHPDESGGIQMHPDVSKCIQKNPDASGGNRVPSESESVSASDKDQEQKSESDGGKPDADVFRLPLPDADADAESNGAPDPGRSMKIMVATRGLSLDQAFIRELTGSTLSVKEIGFAADAVASRHDVQNKPAYFREILKADYEYRKRKNPQKEKPSRLPPKVRSPDWTKGER